MDYDFNKAKNEWTNCPIDDINYFDTKKFNEKSDIEIKFIIDKFIKNRYSLQDPGVIPGVCKKGWRNFNNLWRKHLIDDVENKTIFDFGCGFGVESLQFANNNNKVIVGDINQSNINIANRILKIYGRESLYSVLIDNSKPFFKLQDKIDIFYANGVLHHTPKIREILIEAVKNLNDDGEIRLLLYTDISWTNRTKTEPPNNYDVSITKHPKYHIFVRSMDSVGLYADWYNEEKLNHMFGDFLELKKFLYITSTDEYCVAIFKPK